MRWPERAEMTNALGPVSWGPESITLPPFPSPSWLRAASSHGQPTASFFPSTTRPSCAPRFYGSLFPNLLLFSPVYYGMVSLYQFIPNRNPATTVSTVSLSCSKAFYDSLVLTGLAQKSKNSKSFSSGPSTPTPLISLSSLYLNPFCKKFLRALRVPGIVLGARNTAVSRTEMILPSQSLQFIVRNMLYLGLWGGSVS